MQQQEALGRSKGGFSTKIHLQAEGMGKPMQFVLTPGQTSDVRGFEPLNAKVKVERLGLGRPKQRPHYLLGGQAYNSEAIRRTLRR